MQYKLLNGDSFELLKTFPDNSFDSVVTDPPYGLGFMGKEWDKPENIAFNPEFWTEVLRVLKPGGHLLAFSGSRTYHRMAIAIEDAGFEIRDQIMWLYGSGFPKSQNLGKAIAKKLGDEGTVVGEGKSGSSSRAYQSEDTTTKGGYEIREFDNEWNGWGSALKPAHEPIVMARKPFKGTLVNNVMENGVGGINIDESRIGFDSNDKPSAGIRTSNGEVGYGKNEGSYTPNDEGRFPANVIHDGSEEVINAFPNEAQRFFYGSKCSKADRNEGLDEFNNDHPTIKPTNLMAYLVRLVTPKGGTVLDPFNGSGSTGKAVVLLNKTENKDYKYVGMELDPQYIKITQARMLFTMHNETWLEKKKK